MTGRDFLYACELAVIALLRIFFGVTALLVGGRNLCPECGQRKPGHDAWCEYGEAEMFGR